MKVAGSTAVFTNRLFQDLEQRQAELLRSHDPKLPVSSDLLEISTQARKAYLNASPTVDAQGLEVPKQDGVGLQSREIPRHDAVEVQSLGVRKQDAVKTEPPGLEARELEVREFEVRTSQEITIEHKCLVLILDKLLGIRIRIPDELRAPPKPEPLTEPLTEPQAEPLTGPMLAQGSEPSLPAAYHYKEWSESGRISFKAAGALKTGDGQTVEIAAELNTHRDFVRSHGLNLGAGDARLVDPLIVHCDVPANALRSTRFVFDTDSDGTLKGSIRVGNKTAPLLELGPGHTKPEEHKAESG